MTEQPTPRDESGPRNDRPARPTTTVTVDPNGVHIRDLLLDGPPAELARAAQSDGRDVESVIRAALELGASVMLHGSAMGTLDAVATEVDRLLQALDEKAGRLTLARAARRQMSAKGLDFEDALAPALDACFSSHADVVENTSTATAVGRNKKGDFLVTLNPADTGGRRRAILIEAKSQKMSLNAALAELDAGMNNRSAQVGVLVFASAAQAPLMGAPLRGYPGNRLIVVWDPEAGESLALQVAAQLARTVALSAGENEGRLNRRGLTERLEKVIDIVERAEVIRSARAGLDAAEDAYEQMSEDALSALYEARDRL